MSRTQDAATIRSNVGTLVGWATSNTAMRADLAKNAVTLIEAGLSGLLAAAASDGSLDVRVLDLRQVRAVIDTLPPSMGHGAVSRIGVLDVLDDAIRRAALAATTAASDDRDREVECVSCDDDHDADIHDHHWHDLDKTTYIGMEHGRELTDSEAAAEDATWD